MLNFIYNLPLAQVRRIEYTPSMESFRYQTGALGGVLHIRTKQDSGVLLVLQDLLTAVLIQFQGVSFYRVG